MEMPEGELRTTGVEINYLFVCKRKLWLYTHGISMEQNSTKVEIGKEVHDTSLESKRTEMMIDETIRIDYMDKELTIHEIKMSKAMEEAAKYQILYYIYYLRNKGINCKKGIVHYPETRKTESFEYDPQTEEEIKRAIGEINLIKNSETAPAVERSKKCKKCSYYELCFC